MLKDAYYWYGVAHLEIFDDPFHHRNQETYFMNLYTASCLGHSEAKGALAFYFQYGLYPNRQRLEILLLPEMKEFNYLKYIS
jgi:hypothetical protein